MSAARPLPEFAPGRAAPPAAGPPASLRRILVVDDQAGTAESLALLLALEGYEVKTATDGPQALAAIADFHPDLVLLDLGLPGMDGFAVASHIRNELGLGRLWLVALTGFGQSAERAQAIEAGFNHFLVKPITGKMLAQLIAVMAANPPPAR